MQMERLLDCNFAPLKDARMAVRNASSQSPRCSHEPDVVEVFMRLLRISSTTIALNFLLWRFARIGADERRFHRQEHGK